VASFASPKTLAIFKSPHHGSGEPQPELRFEEAVRSWLEQLATSPSAGLSESAKESREALTDYILPALTQGVIRSTGPREALKSF
jgi:hypothetical protein